MELPVFLLTCVKALKSLFPHSSPVLPTTAPERGWSGHFHTWDSGIGIPEAWMPTIKKHTTRRTERQRTPEETTAHQNSEDRNVPIAAVENQPITAQQHAYKVTPDQSTLPPDEY